MEVSFFFQTIDKILSHWNDILFSLEKGAVVVMIVIVW